MIDESVFTDVGETDPKGWRKPKKPLGRVVDSGNSSRALGRSFSLAITISTEQRSLETLAKMLGQIPSSGDNGLIAETNRRGVIIPFYNWRSASAASCICCSMLIPLATQKSAAVRMATETKKLKTLRPSLDRVLPGIARFVAVEQNANF